MPSRLEAAFWSAFVVFVVCQWAGWGTAATIAAIAFLVLLGAFAVRMMHRMAHGASWASAWGRTRRD